MGYVCDDVFDDQRFNQPLITRTMRKIYQQIYRRT
jgi:hypothetical protein